VDGVQQVADPLTIATRPATELVARFMGDNNIVNGKVTERDGDRMVVEDEHGVRASVRAPGANQAVGDSAMISVRAAAVEVDENDDSTTVSTEPSRIERDGGTGARHWITFRAEKSKGSVAVRPELARLYT